MNIYEIKEGELWQVGEVSSSGEVYVIEEGELWPADG